MTITSKQNTARTGAFYYQCCGLSFQEKQIDKSLNKRTLKWFLKKAQRHSVTLEGDIKLYRSKETCLALTYTCVCV